MSIMERATRNLFKMYEAMKHIYELDNNNNNETHYVSDILRAMNVTLA